MRSQYSHHRLDTVRNRGCLFAVVVPSSVLLDDLMVADDIDLNTAKQDEFEYFSAAQPAAVPCYRSRGTFLGLLGLGDCCF